MKNMSDIVKQLTLLGQLGISLVTPILMCLFVCYLLCSRLGTGVWVYIPGFIMGLGASFMTAYKVYLSVTNKEKKEKKRDVAFNKHI